MYFCLVLLSCQNSSSQSKNVKQTTDTTNTEAIVSSDTIGVVTDHYMDTSLLNKKNSSKYGYYMFTRSTDSTVNLIWGNDTFSRQIVESTDTRILQRISLMWESPDFLILQYGTGSQEWINIALPLNKTGKDLAFSDGFDFDSVRNMVFCPGFVDTALIVRNLRTGQSQNVIQKGIRCGAANYMNCIVGVSIDSGYIYYTWQPDLDKEDEAYERTTKLRL